jgi:hypothetical protein
VRTEQLVGAVDEVQAHGSPPFQAGR